MSTKSDSLNTLMAKESDSEYHNSYGVCSWFPNDYVVWLWIPQWLGSRTLNLWLWSLTPVTSMAMESDSGSLSASTIGRMFLRSTSSTSRSTARRRSPSVKQSVKQTHGTGPLIKVVLQCPFNVIDIPRIFLRSSRGCWGLYRHLSAHSRSRETAEREL